MKNIYTPNEKKTTNYLGRGGWRNGGRPQIENPAKGRGIRLTERDYQNFKKLGGVKWLRETIKKAIAVFIE